MTEARMSDSTTFPSLTEYQEMSWVSCDTPDHAVVALHSISQDQSELRSMFIYLIDASVASANVICDPYFPQLSRVEHQRLPGNADQFQNLIEFIFDDGSISFFYRDIMFSKRTRKLQQMPKRV
jgi:hypothetical protein